jgi:hypothetical protein
MPDKEIMVVDSQRLNMIQNCAYKYNLTFNHNYVPLEKAEPLERGSLIHHMLEPYYKLRMWRGRWSGNKHSLQDIVKICIRIGEWHADKMALGIEEIDDTIRVFKQYVDYYQNEPHETLAVEQVGSKIMYEDDEFILLYETKIDWIFRLTHVPLMPCDHKSSGRRGPVHDLSNQFMGYCWMLGVNNIMINKVGFQTTVLPKDKFQRPIVSYPTPVIEAWKTNSIWWVKMLRFHMRTNGWPQNLTSCDKYSGCIFQEVCLSTPETRLYKIHQMFEKSEETWDVGAKL